MFELADDSTFTKFEEDELQNPSPRKEVDGGAIYLTRELSTNPRKIGAPVLCDLGSAVLGDIEHVEDVQPDIYRAPEVILGIPWSYSIDIWNVGCMVRNTLAQHISKFSNPVTDLEYLRRRLTIHRPRPRIPKIPKQGSSR